MIVTLLYIDDTEADVELMRIMLEPHGIMLDAARTGATGIGIYDPRKHQAVMVDWNLPDMDGLTVARALLAHYPHCRIAFLSALYEEEHIAAAHKLGIVHCFEKNLNIKPTRDFICDSAEDERTVQ